MSDEINSNVSECTQAFTYHAQLTFEGKINKKRDPLEKRADQVMDSLKKVNVQRPPG